MQQNMQRKIFLCVTLKMIVYDQKIFQWIRMPHLKNILPNIHYANQRVLLDADDNVVMIIGMITAIYYF